jgi:transposase-like protein
MKMSREKLRSYSKEFKAQIIKECIETNNYAVVAKKHDVPATTVYTWFRRDKNKQKTDIRKSQRALERELADAKLEIAVLKDLLKKTNQLWLKS